MKKSAFCIAFILSAMVAAAPLTEEKKLDKIPSLKWRTAVASVAPGTMKSPQGKATIKCTYPIIYDETGKPKGTTWPRCNVPLSPDMRDWSRYDYLEFSVYTTFNRSDEEYLPLTLGIGGEKTKTLNSYDIKTLAQNQWVKVSLPLRQMKRGEKVRSMQFHLNARRYFHNDKLELTIGDFKLVRLLQWQVAAFRMTAPAIFSDRTTLPVEYELLGPGEKSKVPFRIYTANGKKLRDITLESARGFAFHLLPVGKLAPGKYLLAVFPDAKEKRHEASFEVVAAPAWNK